ncbi:MAG: PTH1 family peptidyl-tRNA hydrolase [Rickettsiales bacterium]|jgi:PTH1 family peptidyl-tRNA hydrolase
MILLVGLGNPGTKYENTRHNAGFLAIEHLSDKFSFDKKSDKFDSEFFSGEISSKKIIAIKPQAFMNLSGSAVQKFSTFYKIPTDKIFVFHDEIDLKIATHKIKFAGGNAGHNGLKDIDSKIGKNYHRIRIGVGRPEDSRFEISDYVLGKFSLAERNAVNQQIINITDNIENILAPSSI